MDKINICTFPTKVLIVDDNESFLKTLKSVVNHNANSYAFLNNPHEALTYLKSAMISENNCLKHISSINIDEYDQLSINLHINNLHKEIYNPHRFNMISLLVTDYDMPGINGLELCQTLNNVNITRSLLTGVADKTTAVAAFNDGLINNFLKKDELDILASLRTLIIKSQENYFNTISNGCVKITV